MAKFKASMLRVVGVVYTFSFALIMGSVFYFILGTVAKLVGGDILGWTFCGTTGQMLNVDWCDARLHTGLDDIDGYSNRFINMALPWFMMFWGLVLGGISYMILKLTAEPNVTTQPDANHVV